jgi:hypothetical protein
MSIKKILAAILPFIVLGCSPALAGEWEKYDKPVPTRVVVRVLSHGAKAMGDKTGAVVVIRDADTGRELDEGPVRGGTGDDIALMRAGYPRMLGAMGLVKGEKGMLFEDLNGSDKAPYFDLRDTAKREKLKPVIYESKADSAMFETTLNITRPTRIIVEAHGPLTPTQATASAATSAWVFPGEDMTGDGIVLELRGIIVDSPSLKDKEIKISEAKDGITVPFSMKMLCGCIIVPAGQSGIPWEAEGYKVTTQAYYKGKLYYEDVKTSDKLYIAPSQFETKVPLPEDLPSGAFKKERVKVRIMSFQQSQDNSGMDEFSVYLSR